MFWRFNIITSVAAFVFMAGCADPIVLDPEDAPVAQKTPRLWHNVTHTLEVPSPGPPMPFVIRDAPAKTPGRCLRVVPEDGARNTTVHVATIDASWTWMNPADREFQLSARTDGATLGTVRGESPLRLRLENFTLAPLDAGQGSAPKGFRIVVEKTLDAGTSAPAVALEVHIDYSSTKLLNSSMGSCQG